MLRRRLRNIRRWLRVVVAALVPATAFAGPADPPRGPYIAVDRPGFDRCRGEDPRPCPGRLLEIHNPKRRPVVVVVTCGAELLPLRTKVRVPAHRGRRPGTAVLDLGTDRPGGLPRGRCVIEAWFYAKR